MPLEAGSGEAIARALATSSTSAILSLKGMRVAERSRFVTDLFETLAAENRGLLNLVIDEVHLFAPQSGGTGLTPAMLHATNNLVSTGRAAGLRVAMISQRPAKVHKDSLTQASTLVALRCAHPLDQRPIRDWLSTTVPDKDRRAEIMASLAALPTGAGWLSAPQQGVLERVAFPLIETFDSSRPGVEEIPLKPLDVDALRKALAAAAPAQSEATAAPKRRASEPGVVAEQRASPAELAAAEQRGYDKGYESAAKTTAAEARLFINELRGRCDSFEKRLESSWFYRDEGCSESHFPDPASLPCAPPRAPSAAPARTNGHAPSGVAALPPACKLGAERRILAVLAGAHPAGMTEAQWAVAAGMKRSGGTWGTYKSRLRVAGAIEDRGGQWFVTAQGMELAGAAAEPMPSPGPELVEFWIGRISGVGPMLRELARRYPRPIKRERLAEAIAMTASGGTFGTYLSRLSAAGLIEKSGGAVRAAPALMERA